MERIAVGLGFCGSFKRDSHTHVTDFIPSYGPVTADQFTDWVFLADDINTTEEPERWLRLRRQIRDAFVQYMGAETVDASELDWASIRLNSEEEADTGEALQSRRKFRGEMQDLFAKKRIAKEKEWLEIIQKEKDRRGLK